MFLRLRSAKSDGKSRQFCTPWPKMWVWNMPFVSVLRSFRWSSRALGSAEELFPSTKDEQELKVSLTKTLLVQVLNRTQTNERSEVSFHFAVPFRFCLCSATVLFPTNVFSLGTFSSHSFWHLEQLVCTSHASFWSLESSQNRNKRYVSNSHFKSRCADLPSVLADRSLKSPFA